MARPRPSLSITLPPTLDIPSQDDGAIPKTPDQRDEPQSAAEPPPPPRQPYKLKRRRAAVPMPLEEPLPLPDDESVIPTIEMSEAVSELSSPVLQPTPSSDGFLHPLPSFQRLVTPPKTPSGHLNPYTPTASPSHEWSLITDNKRPSFERSGSVCSSFSDSSISSAGSSAFSAPINGSCTSPESVTTDPFMEDEMSKAEKLFMSPGQGDDSPTAKRVKRQQHVKWTPAMDQHLENTYISYLRDPRVTPFKTLPGVAPPLGVCSRVAAKARRTWSPHRAGTPTPLDTILESGKTQREGSPDTIRPETSEGKYSKQQQPSWPSDAAARKRLRKLVKAKPALSAHYQRLLRTRSPSPFPSSAPSRSSEAPSTSFSGRDMKLSLITSTAPSMQPEAPLAQLTSEDTVKEEAPARPQSQRGSRPPNWFNRIGRAQAHQKSRSLQASTTLQAMQQSAPLAPPFDDVSHRSHLLHSMSTTKSLGRKNFSGNAPSLDSPIAITGAPTAPRSLKRRFKSDEEKPRRPGIEDVFGPPTEDVGIVRNRGFTVGAVRANDNLAKIFEPPAEQPSSSVDQEMTEAPPAQDSSHLGPIGSRSAPRRLAEPIPRLGSPFMEVSGSNRPFNTFPRSYIPTASNPQPFQDRLRELAAQSQQN